MHVIYPIFILERTRRAYIKKESETMSVLYYIVLYNIVSYSIVLYCILLHTEQNQWCKQIYRDTTTQKDTYKSSREDRCKNIK